MGSCICYLIAPLFKKGDTKWVSDEDFLKEELLCGVLCILSVISFWIYDKTFKKEMPVVTKKPEDQKTIEIGHIDNEDMDQEGKEGVKGGLKMPVTTKPNFDDVKVTSQSNEDFVH